MADSTEVSAQEKNSFSMLKIVFTILSIVILRLFLENFVYPSDTGYFFSVERLLHAILYFFSLFLSLSIITYFFTKVSFEKILLFITKIFLFILAVPIIDLAFSATSFKGQMSYLIINLDKFFTFFFSIINPLSGQGVTPGQHFVAYAMLLSIAFFVYKKNKHIIDALILVVFGYTVLFFYEMLPSFVVLLGNKGTLINQSALDNYHAILNQSWLPYYTEGFSFLNKTILQTEIFHEIAMAKIFFILLVLQIIVIFSIVNKNIWNVLKNNLRLERIAYWFIIAIIGIYINMQTSTAIGLQNPINIISLAVFFILIVLNIWFAVFVNDAEDIITDKISNPNRPLIAKHISLQSWNQMQIFLLILIILGSATLNKATLFLLVLAQISYYLYSSRPLRLKYNFITSSILIGIASVAIAMAGFFLVSHDQHVSAFPVGAIFIIGISYALLSNLKDIKDFAGDSCEGIKTIPVVFGLKNSKYIIASLCSLVIITVPVFLEIYSILPISICISAFLFYLFTKKEYQEKYIFFVFFLFFLSAFFIINA